MFGSGEVDFFLLKIQKDIWGIRFCLGNHVEEIWGRRNLRKKKTR